MNRPTCEDCHFARKHFGNGDIVPDTGDYFCVYDPPDVWFDLEEHETRPMYREVYFDGECRHIKPIQATRKAPLMTSTRT